MALIVILLAYTAHVAFAEIDKVHNQLEIVTMKLNEIESRPFVAFRAASMQKYKNAKTLVRQNPGEKKAPIRRDHVCIN